MAGDRILLDDAGPARAKLFQTAQHMAVAAIMISSGYAELSGNGHGSRLLAILELAAGALLFVAIAAERRRHRAGAHGRFGWIEIASGILLFVEGLSKHRDGKWFHADYFSAVVVVALGLFEGPFSRFRARLRYLEDGPDALVGRTGRLRRFRVEWARIREARFEGSRIVFLDDRGQERRLRLSRFRNKEAIRSWIADRFSRRGLAWTDSGAPPPS